MFGNLFNFLSRKEIGLNIVAVEHDRVKILMSLWGFEVVDRPVPAVYIEDQPKSKLGKVFGRYVADSNEISLHSDISYLWKGNLAHELTHSCQPVELLDAASAAFVAGDLKRYKNDAAERQARIVQLNRVMPFTPIKLYKKLGLKAAETLLWTQFVLTVVPVLVAAKVIGKKFQYR